MPKLGAEGSGRGDLHRRPRDPGPRCAHVCRRQVVCGGARERRQQGRIDLADLLGEGGNALVVGLRGVERLGLLGDHAVAGRGHGALSGAHHHERRVPLAEHRVGTDLLGEDVGLGVRARASSALASRAARAGRRPTLARIDDPHLAARERHVGGLRGGALDEQLRVLAQVGQCVAHHHVDPALLGGGDAVALVDRIAAGQGARLAIRLLRGRLADHRGHLSDHALFGAAGAGQQGRQGQADQQACRGQDSGSSSRVHAVLLGTPAPVSSRRIW